MFTSVGFFHPAMYSHGIMLLSFGRTGESTPWPSWWRPPGQTSSSRRSPDPKDRQGLEVTWGLGWRAGPIWFAKRETTCSSRCPSRFYRACRCWGGRSLFWTRPLVGPLGTPLARRARNRRDRPHKESQLGLRSSRRSVCSSSRLAQRRYRQLGLERVFGFPKEKIRLNGLNLNVPWGFLVGWPSF